MEFIKLREEHLEQVLKWRVSEQVTTYMYTDIEPNLDNQRKWFEKISRDEHSQYWVISSRNQGIGLVSLNDISWNHRRTSWAYYIGDSNYNMLGAMIAPYLYNYAFLELKLNKLQGEVMEGNINVRNIHLKHGCREVGVLKEHIYKNGKFHDVYIYEMLAANWKDQLHKYRKFQARFED
jgi:UDP-4-amino-4,6-dideoxy-N-acetyl-beta-L-altrosamine N-acetyltransferase